MSSVGSAADPPIASVASVIPLVPVWRVDRAFDYAVPEGMHLEPGMLVRIPFGHRKVRGIVTKVDDSDAEGLEVVAGTSGPAPVAPPPSTRLLDWISTRYCVPRGQVYKACVPDRVRVALPPPLPLRPAGAPDVFGGYEGGPPSPASGTWCIRPRPGERAAIVSALIERAAGWDEGAALVALPEVEVPSLVAREVARLWPDMARLDTSQPPGERSAGWYRMARGHGLAVGGRATLLAPAPDLALILMVEETHPSFKDDRTPRTESWRVASYRAALQGATTAFVSHAPALEIAYRVTQGEAGVMEPSRMDERSLRPLVELVARPSDRTLSRELHQRIGETLGGGSSVALVVPQRGWARTLWCASCRHSLRCVRCDAGLAEDRAGLRCPRCGDKTPRPERCPSCGETVFISIGAGDERIEEQLAKSFPRARVIKIDDPRSRPSEAAGDIYVTTLAGTKEDVRPEVALVGVLDADALIRRPDFRAAERAHRALSGLCSWAGPASEGGRLLLQTAEPSHHAIQAVVRSDYWFFVERELPVRRELGYPPFSELIKVSATGTGSREAIDRAASVGRDEHARVLGPIVVTDPRSHEKRLEILMKCDDAMLVSEALRGILPEPTRGTRLRIEVDPR